jgi:CHASE2 domain-containing sensor protein
MRIFISYRRDDSVTAARLIHNELSHRFGADAVFMDIDDIGWGDDFVRAIDEHIVRADVVLVIIGPRWAEILEQHACGDDDWVRHEVRAALACHAEGAARVVPVFVNGGGLPASKLPPDIDGLRFLNGPRFDERQLKAGITAIFEAVQGESFEECTRRLRRQALARWSAGTVGAVVFFAAWAALFEAFAVDTWVHGMIMRLSHALPGGAAARWSGEVVLVAIDKEAVDAVGRAFDRSWRTEMAAVVERAAAAGARTLAIDISFADRGDEAGDAALERAVEKAKGSMPVVVAVHDLEADRPAILPRLQPHVSWGVACLGRRLRAAHMLPLVLRRREGAAAGLWPSFGLAAYMSYMGHSHMSDDSLKALVPSLTVEQTTPRITTVVKAYTAETIRLESGCAAIQRGDFVVSQLVDTYAMPPLDGPAERLSFASVLRGDARALEALRNRIALVGTMFRNEDRHPTMDGRLRFGMEFIAAQVDGLVRQAAIRPLSPQAQVLMMVTLAVTGAGMASALRGPRQRWRWPALAAFAVAYGLGCVLWYRTHQQLVGLHYGVLALGLGAGLASRMARR